MSVLRLATVAAVGLLATGWLQAASAGGPTVPPNFNVALEGWDAGQMFSAMTDSTDTSGFTSGSVGMGFCLLPDSDCTDPRFNLNVGGDPTDVGQSFNFTADGNGGGTTDFLNIGPDITNVVITTTITPDQQNEFFTCSSDEFQFCGFKDPDNTLEILFSDPINGGIPSATPEPSQYALLLIAFAGIVAGHWIRSRRSSRVISD